MQAQELIQKINTSAKLEDVISDVVLNLNTEYKEIAKLLHPDVCNLDGAGEALSKLNEWKEIYRTGRKLNDDASAITTNGYWVRFESEEPCLEWSKQNYNILRDRREPADEVFKKYIPKDKVYEMVAPPKFGTPTLNQSTLRFDKRAIPLSGLTLPQEHVKWILNRMLEYTTYLSNIGMVHGGFTPESIFIVPETHGIQVVSFYHMTRQGQKIGTISGQYAGWYPKSVFDTKIATEAIDIQMAKNIAIYLLGDKSGSGTSLRKTCDKELINFLLTHHTNAYEAMSQYKAYIAKGTSKFHTLSI